MAMIKRPCAHNQLSKTFCFTDVLLVLFELHEFIEFKPFGLPMY